MMISLTQKEKEDFLDRHLPHRLTLLRTLRERKNLGKSYQGEADIYCCVKDSNLIAVRLLLDFLGLKGEVKNCEYILLENPRKRNSKYDDDIKLDQFVSRLVQPGDIPVESQRILAGIYKRADKELAHMTSMFNDEFNEEDTLIQGATIIENLIETFLYRPVGRQLPVIKP